MAPVVLTRVPETTQAGVATGRSIDLIHHRMDQPQSFGDFAHGTYTASKAQIMSKFISVMYLH